MLRSRGLGRLGLVTVGLGIGAAVASTPGVASGDSSTDWLSSIDQLLGGLSVPAADSAEALDMQISIGGTLLFPYEDNTAIAMAGPGNIAIAMGDNSYASAQNGAFDFAFANGTNSFAEAEIGNFDVAVADGADSVAKAGFYAEPISGLFSPTSFDSALVFGVAGAPFAGFGGIATSVGFFDLASPLGASVLAQAIAAPFLVDIAQ